MKTLFIGVFAIIFISALGAQQAFSHHVTSEIEVSKTPMQMSITDEFVYVASFAYPHITIIDKRSNENIGFITTSAAGIMAVEAVPELNKIYASPFERGGIDVYDLSSRQFIKTIPLPSPELVAPSTSGQLWGQRASIHFLTGGWALDSNPDEALLYVADYNNHRIYVIDSNSDEVVETIEVARKPFSVKVDPESKTIIVASLAGNEITFIEDVTGPTAVKPSHAIVKTIKMTGGPWGLDIDPETHKAYVTNRGCECITVIDIVEKKIIDTIQLGDKAQAIAVDTDEHQIFVSYLTQNKMVKIDGETQQIVLSYDLDGQLWDIEVDPQTHRVYSTLKTEDKVLVFGPKSFSISLPVVTLQSPSTFVGMLHVHGQDILVSNAFLDLENTQLVMDLQAEDGGRIAVGIPKDMLDSRNGVESNFEVRIDQKRVTAQEMLGMANARLISVQVPPNAQSITITGNMIFQEIDTPMQTPTIPSVQLTDGSKIICEDKVWMESTKGRIACVTPSTAQKLVERGWGTILE